jgi:hypothetical protein
MSIKITGLDGLKKQLDDAAKALHALDGNIATLKFNPNDPSSVEAAVVEVEQTIDRKVALYRGNKMVETVIAQLKDRYRQEIYDRAAKARMQEGAT